MSTPGSREMAPGQYTFVRQGGFYDRMYYLWHRLGLQANILVSARYNNRQGGSALTKSIVFSALRQTVEAHPGLAAVAVIQPASKKGRHTLQRVMLHSIDLRSCVDFIDDEEVTADASFFEHIHNQWLFMDDEPIGPWWRVYVLGRRDVVFVFHHFVCDGKAGYEFHRSFLEALNSLASDSSMNPEPVIYFDPKEKPMPPNAMEYSPIKLSVVRAIMGVLYWIIIRFLYGNRLFFSDLPPPKPYLLTVTGCAKPSQRTVTRIASFRILKDKMAKITAACRTHNTTFSPLLTVVTMAALATKMYPDAKLGFVQTALDIRSLLRYPEEQNGDRIIWNASGAALEMVTLSKIHRALGTTDQKSKSGAALSGMVDSAPNLWPLVQEYKSNLEDEFKGSRPPALQLWLSGNMLGPYLEDMVERAFPSLGLQQQNSVAFSNLGRFPANQGETGGDLEKVSGKGWKIEEVQFSTSVTGGSVSNHGPRMNIAGINGGDTIVNVAWEDGILSKEMVDDIWECAMKYIDAML